MKLTNQQIYTYAQELSEAFSNNERYIPTAINFCIQKNITILMGLAQEIEEAKIRIGAMYGHVSEDGNSFSIERDYIDEAQKELNELFEIEQEVDIKNVRLSVLTEKEDCQFTPNEMKAIMFMIEED